VVAEMEFCLLGPRPSARATLRNYVKQLRKALRRRPECAAPTCPIRWSWWWLAA